MLSFFGLIITGLFDESMALLANDWPMNGLIDELMALLINGLIDELMARLNIIFG